MSRMENITEETIVVVTNDYDSTVGYTTEKVTRVWEPNSFKKVSVAELQDVMNTRGGRYLFEEHLLLLKETEVRHYLGLEPIGQYDLEQKDIVKLLENSNLADFEDVLQYCGDMTLEKIVSAAIALPLADLNKTNLLKSYSGINIVEAIQETLESNVKPAAGAEPIKRKRVAQS